MKPTFSRLSITLLFSSRYRLHKQIYNHHAVKAFEYLLIPILQKIKDSKIDFIDFTDSIVLSRVNSKHIEELEKIYHRELPILIEEKIIIGPHNISKLELEKQTSIEELNATIKKYALEGNLVEQIKYSLNNELVSSDIVGSSAPSIFDSNATIVAKDGKNIVIYVWYDNEYGYSHQVIRLAKHISKVRRYTYY